MFRLILLILLLLTNQVFALENPAQELHAVTPRDRLGTPLDLSLPFRNSQGKKVELGQYFNQGRPVIVVPGYFTCPRMCGLVFGGVAKLIKEMDLDPGEDYQVLTVSFDHQDTAENAQKKEAQFTKLIKEKTDNPDSWKFLVGAKESISRLMSQLGFKYLKDGKEFAHTAAIYLITPDGKISQYFTGVSFSRFDVKLALVESSKGQIGSLLDQALLFCFGFDHIKGKYVWVVNGAVKIGGILTLLLLGGFLFKQWSQEVKNR